MSKRGYGQFCGFARAVEVLGERWAFMIVRNLLVGPRRFNELQRSLPKVPTNILALRLKELEEDGVVERRAGALPGSGVQYALTPRGRELEPAIFALGRWGAKELLDMPREGEILTDDAMVTALRATFRPEAAAGVCVSYELRLGPVTIHARVDDGSVDVRTGPMPDADVVVEASPAIRALMAGEMTPREALASGHARITGDPELFETFASLFRIV